MIIKEAYYGLAEHIFHIEAGMAPGSSNGLFELPSDVESYKQCQVIPVAKQLQLLVHDSSLELSKELLIPKQAAPNIDRDDEETQLLK